MTERVRWQKTERSCNSTEGGRGKLFGFAGKEIAGATELLKKCKAKVVVHKAEAEFIKGFVSSDMIKTDNGDKLDVGGLEIQLIDWRSRADVLQPDAEVDGVARRHGLFPGHNYAPLKHATVGEQKKINPYLKFSSLKQFLAAMGSADLCRLAV
jgi:hypothetical protein